MELVPVGPTPWIRPETRPYQESIQRFMRCTAHKRQGNGGLEGKIAVYAQICVLATIVDNRLLERRLSGAAKKWHKYNNQANKEVMQCNSKMERKKHEAVLD